MFGLQNIGMPEILVVAVVLLVIFGPKKVPELAKGISDAVRELTSGFKGKKKEDTEKTEKKKK
jgi:sec-independent protein translocase protein TatA